MVSTAKRFAAGLTAAVWLVFSVIFPVTVHAATYNAASNLTGRMWYVPGSGALAGTQVVATAATALARANPWLAAISLGTPIVQFLLEKNGGNRLVVTGRTAKPPVSAWGGPTPPSQTTPRVMWSGYNGNYYEDPDTACTQLCTDQHSWSGTASWCTAYTGKTALGTSWNCLGTLADGRTNTSFSGTGPSTRCPDGYTLSGSVCNMTTETNVKWPNDGIPTYTRSTDGTTLVQHPRDTDPLPASPTPADIMNPSMNYGPDPFGNPTSINITPSATGFRIDQRVQTTVEGQTSSTIQQITVRDDGVVTATNSTTVAGGLETANPTSAPITAGSGISIQFPDDYNREATQQQIKQKLDDLLNAPTAANSPDYKVEEEKTTMDQDIKDKADAIPGQYSDDKSNWFSWVWTPPVGNCSPIGAGTIHGQAFAGWNICPYVDKVRDVIGYLLAVGSAWVVYLQMFRKED